MIEENSSRASGPRDFWTVVQSSIGANQGGVIKIPGEVGNREDSLMEPPPRSGPDGMGGLRFDLLRTAVATYLKIAYPSGAIPEVVRRRLVWPEGLVADSILTKPPFERAGKMPGHHTLIYALRLGNYRYPHMKLQIQPWENDAGFMLSVNTHDQVAGLDVGAADAQAFRELQAENQRLKEAIEQAWDDAGLPTFLRYLREYIRSQSRDVADPSGQSPSAGDPTDRPPHA